MAKTLQSKLANKYNKRIRAYSATFGKDFVSDLIGDIVGIDYTKSGFISTTSFTGENSEIVINELERKLPTVTKQVDTMRNEIVETWNKRGLQGPPNTTRSNVIREIKAKHVIEEEFEENISKFYDLKDLAFTDVPKELEKNIGGGNPFNSYQHMVDVLNQIKDLVNGTT